MQPEEFVYPPYGAPLVEAYNGRFEAAFVVLHPFIRVEERLAWRVTRKYPDDADIIAHGSRFPWTEVCGLSGLSSLARLNQALLTATGSLKGDFGNSSARDMLQGFLQSQPVWMPAQGRFEPLLQRNLLAIFASAGYEEVIHVPEFPNADPIVRLAVTDLEKADRPFPSGGTLLAPDLSFLFTVEWDSFFTLFYGSRAFVAGSMRKLGMEGFFATANTDHVWFNYSMGCATVTLSPEHWQLGDEGSK